MEISRLKLSKTTRKSFTIKIKEEEIILMIYLNGTKKVIEDNNQEERPEMRGGIAPDLIKKKSKEIK
ncbi:hypothetical protein QQG55_21785 [Brugia pahangi]